MHHKGSSSGPGRAWGGAFMAFTISWHLRKPLLQFLPGPGEEALRCSCSVLCAIQYALWSLHGIYHFMAFTEASSPVPSRAWRGGFKVFLFGALCYTMCTMKPSWHLPFHGIYRSLLSRPFQGLERRLHGVPVRCSVLYNMHYEGYSPGPGEEPSWHLS